MPTASCVVLDDRRAPRGADGEDARLRRVEDRGELCVPYMPRLETENDAAFELVLLEPPRPCALGEVGDAVR